ncbi:uncharacterized protein LOC101210144 isoform X2 [Cucumis sativus]|uniref:uncharacterized protein LOC101210144 isoform X2 n=1 Tax=Cucumis sativus TaxID=3659 RepID=UPI0005ECC279|nr:uncharacterized protein LOC101210144 isoform X2 [Cucumis sativus]
MSASIVVAEAVWKQIESTRLVTDDQLSILHFLFGKNFERATRIVDQRGVKKISGHPSTRSIFQLAIKGSIGNEYKRLWLWENLEGKRSISVSQKTFVPVIPSSMTL